MLRTAVVGVIVAAGAVAGCGTASAPGAGGTGAAGSHAHAAKATLTINVNNMGRNVRHWTLRCDPTGGTTPDRATVCRTLFGNRNVLTPLRHHVMCPMIMVSGKQIVVDGTWFGKKVHRVIIDGGCDLLPFNDLSRTFGAKVFY